MELHAYEQQPDAAALKKIIEVIEMQDNAEFMGRFYSEAGKAKVAARRELWSPELQERVSRQWTELFRDIEASLDEDPGSEKALALAARWNALVEEFSGGYPDITEGVGNVWANHHQWPESLKQQARLQTGHVGSVAAAHVQDVHQRQSLDGLAQRTAGQPEFSREVGLARQPVPRT